MSEMELEMLVFFGRVMTMQRLWQGYSCIYRGLHQASRLHIMQSGGLCPHSVQKTHVCSIPI